MFSFRKEEPPIRWEGKTSVLDDWSKKRMSLFPNGKPLNTRPGWMMYSREAEKDRNNWPFNWDWNGLFTHDFPLLQLPHTVLLEVLKLLDNDSRRELSWSCRLLRRLIVNNQTPAMDRRRIDRCLEVYLFNDFIVLFEDCHDKTFDSLSSILDFVKTYRKSFFIEKVRIFINDTWDPLVDFSQVVQAFEGTKTEAHNMSTVTPSLMLIGKMLNAFLKYPHLVHIELSSFDRMPLKWNEYCTTVSTWAESNNKRMGSETERYSDYVFRKEDSGGQTIIVICSSTGPRPRVL